MLNLGNSKKRGARAVKIEGSESIGEEISTEIDKSDTHSAVSSWSGYDFQGKIAVYTVLCLINEMGISKEDIQSFTLEIEHLEDFSIKFNGSYYSIHQVKSYQSKGKDKLNSYKGAILDLLGKCASYEEIKFAHLHSTCSIDSVSKEEVETLLKEYNSTKKVEQIKRYKKLLFDEGKFNLLYEKLYVNDDLEEKIFKRVVDITEIEEEIKEQIKCFYEKNEDKIPIEFADIDENLDYIYNNLLAEIDCFVIEQHKKISEKPEIPFVKFMEILVKRHVFVFSNKTAASLLKDVIQNSFLEYCADNDICPINDKEICINWERNWGVICSLSDEEFLILCKKISPDIVMTKKNISLYEYRNLLSDAGVNKTLFPMVMAIKDTGQELTGVKDIFVLNKLGLHHLITTISKPMAKNAVPNTGRKIFDNLKRDNTLAHLLFDINKLITTELEGFFEGPIIDVRKAYEEEFDLKEVEKETIISPKRMEFMPIEQAKEEFR